MKKISLFIISLCCTLNISAQETSTESFEIQSVIDACISMRDAVAANNATAIRQAASDLKSVEVSDFKSLRCKDDTMATLKGHLIFDEAFADSIAEGNLSVYDKADELNRFRTVRGQTQSGKYFTKTCFVKAGKSTKWSFASKGHQELAVVAEAGGLVTMKVHVTNSSGLDRRFDDTKYVKKGLPQRKVSFELPYDKRNTVEMEIINCGKKDCSFVVISN